MIARRLKTILPPLSIPESLALIQIHSATGSLRKTEEISTERPFRSPHHTISSAGLIGGGSQPKAGEVSSSTQWSTVFRRTSRISKNNFRKS